jgi:predicted ArsR family transcriptional regulator
MTRLIVSLRSGWWSVTTPLWDDYDYLSSDSLTYLSKCQPLDIFDLPRTERDMTQINVNQRLLESTRGRILTLLRCSTSTVEELAQSLDLTDNAVRAHLATLERDGMVRPAGVRRGPGAGKPSTMYELAPDAEVVFSRAYPPVLAALLEELVARLPTDQTEALLLGLGQRLAGSFVAPAAASHRDRLRAAVGVLNALGGAAELEEHDGSAIIRGCGCPLAAAVARQPETCRAVESLLSAVVGVPVRQCCRHGERPSCCFEIAPAV